MAAARYYSSTSGEMNLMLDIGDADTSITVDSTAGLPGARPYTLVLDPGTASEEIVDVTNASGNTLTVTRGVDGSSAQAHAAGVGNVRHMATARDFREAQEHIAASIAHGTTGSVVGTSDVQTLTNKDLSDPSNVLPSSLATDAEVTAAVAAHAAVTATHGATGAVVGTTNAQTLTNKTISGADNTLADIPETAVTGLTTDLAGLDARLDSLESTAGVVGSIFASTTGDWTINTQQAIKVGRVVCVYLNITLTAAGAPLGGPSGSGDFANSPVGTLKTEYLPAMPASLGVNASGGLMASGIWTDGGVFVSAGQQSTTYLAGATFAFAGTYLAAAA